MNQGNVPFPTVSSLLLSEQYLLEKAEGGIEKIGLISSERSREETVGKGTFP